MAIALGIRTGESGGVPAAGPGSASSPKAWCVVLLAAVLLYGVVYALYWDKYQTGGNAQKYDISAEIYKRLLFAGDIEGIDRYTLDVYGEDYHILENGFGSAVTDERPVYFFYLAVIKLFQTFPVGLNFALNAVCLIAALVLLAHALNPPNKSLFVLLGAVVMSPFTLHQAFVYEPHVLELFLSCLGIFFYARDRLFCAFFFMTLSLALHTGNLVLFGCLGLHYLCFQWRNWRGHLAVALGVAAGLACIEGLYWMLFSRDVYGVLPHDFFLERMVLKSGRTTGEFAKSPGGLNFFRNALVYLPLGTLGAFWVRNKFQFFVTLLPLLIYLVASKGMMPGVHRVLLPVFFLGYGFFLLHLLALGSGWRRRIAVVLVLAAAGSTLAYHSYVAGCLSLRESVPVSVAEDGGESARLHWNLSRFNEVVENGKAVYGFETIPLMEEPNVPDPILFYPHAILKSMYEIVPEKLRKKMQLHDPAKTQSTRLFRKE